MIDRSMLEHPIVGIKNPLRFAAWAWMLSSARYKAGIYYDAGHEINLTRGQFVCGRKFMAKETGMTEKQVRVFLVALERSGMCLKAVHPKGQGINIITICNYDVYQDYDAYKAKRGPRLGPSEGQGRAKVGPHSVTPDETPEETKVLLPTKAATKETPKSVLCKYAGETSVSSFLEYRRKKKGGALTVTAAKRLSKHLDQINLDGGDADDALGMAEEKGWTSVEPTWYFNMINQQRNGGRKNGNGNNNTNDPALESISRAARAR